MNIKIFYDNGRVDEFDTSDFTTSLPFTGTNMLTNYEVRFDTLQEENLWLHAHYYEINDAYAAESESNEVPVARRKKGWRFLLVDKREIDQVAKIIVDGEVAGWRQGGMFVNGIRFSQISKVCCPIKDTASYNAKAIAIHDYLAYANPSLALREEELCSLFGFSADAYARVRNEEAMQPAKTNKSEEEKKDQDSWVAEVKKEKGL